MPHPPNPLRFAIAKPQGGMPSSSPCGFLFLLAKQSLKLTENYCGEIPTARLLFELLSWLRARITLL